MHNADRSRQNVVILFACSSAALRGKEWKSPLIPLTANNVDERRASVSEFSDVYCFTLLSLSLKSF